MTDILQRLRNPEWIDHDGQADVLHPTKTEADMGEAADEIERLREIVRRLDQLAMGAAGHISNKGIAADYRKNILLCQTVGLELERIRAAKAVREQTQPK